MSVRIWKSEDGQDWIEYTFLLASVALDIAGLTVQTGAGMTSAWNTANNVLTAAGRSAS